MWLGWPGSPGSLPFQVLPLGASSPTSPRGAVNSLESPCPEAARRKAANTVVKGKQMDRECAPSLSAPLGGKAQATSKACYMLSGEEPSTRLPNCLLFQGQPATRVAVRASASVSRWAEECSDLPAPPGHVFMLGTWQ